MIRKSDYLIEKLIKDSNIKIYKTGKIHRKVHNKWSKAKLTETKTGYLTFSYKGSHLNVHRIIYRAFNNYINSKYPINHIDGNKRNNHIKNLENISPSQNINHHIFTRKKHTKITKLTHKDVIEILSNKKLSTKELSKKYKVSRVTINDIKSKRTWSGKSKNKVIIRKFKNNDDAIKDLIKNDLYFITPDGKIFTLIPSKGSGLLSKPRLIQTLRPNGYYTLRYKMTNLLVHRIIFAKYGGKLKKGLVINHIDGNSLNNCITNLEQTTYSKNNSHTIRVLRKGNVKLTESAVKEIRELYLSTQPFSIKEQANKYKVSTFLIKNVIYNQAWIDPNYKPISRTNDYPKKLIKKVVSLIFNKKTTSKKASLKYRIPHSTIKYWVREEKIRKGLNTKDRL